MTFIARTLCLIALLATQASAASLPFQGLDEKSLIQMGGYGPVVLVESKPQEKFPWVSAGVLIEAPPEVVWSVITDFAHYKDFLPQTRDSDVTKSDAKSADVDLGIRVEFTSLIGITVEYSIRYELVQPPYRMTWKRTKGDIRYTKGEWNILPVDGGKRSMAFYSISSDLSSMGAIVGYVLKKQPSLEVAIQSSTAILVAEATKKQAELVASQTPPALPQATPVAAPAAP